MNSEYSQQHFMDDTEYQTLKFGSSWVLSQLRFMKFRMSVTGTRRLAVIFHPVCQWYKNYYYREPMRETCKKRFTLNRLFHFHWEIWKIRWDPLHHVSYSTVTYSMRFLLESIFVLLQKAVKVIGYTEDCWGSII